jgi:NADH-quinone oxidoreductase subunit F
MAEPVLFQNRRTGRSATLDEYRGSGGYQALADIVKGPSPEQVRRRVLDSGLRGRGGAGFPTGRKWGFVREDASHPRYVVANADEMEPGTFKDRALVNVDPHMVIEGMILAAYAVSAQQGVFFIRPSYEREARLIERELQAARDAGYLGRRILETDFSFDIAVHRSGGRYICGEASAQVAAIEGRRPRPDQTRHMTDDGLWGKPTVVNNVETLACVPHILRKGADWFKGLAKSETGAGTKLYCVSGKVAAPGCYELPIGTRLSEIIEGDAGGMLPGSKFKACLPGGASTGFMTRDFYHVEMDFDPLRDKGQRLGTAAIVVFDQGSCLVGTTLNLIQYFARESCGLCTPCREGLPFVRDLLRRIEEGEGKEADISRLREMAHRMQYAYCALAPGAAAPLKSLLDHFEEEMREHISQRRCPFKG